MSTKILDRPQRTAHVEQGNSVGLEEFRARFVPDGALNLPDKSYIIDLQSSSSISASDSAQCFELLRTTSENDYRTSSGGWHPVAKRKEMRLPDLRYLIVRSASSASVLGFASCMLTYEDGEAVVYLYEIHISETVRGRGLGRRLMAIVEQIGELAGMNKIMLTVFLANEEARRFYERAGLEEDEFSPKPRKLRTGMVRPDYVILSKALNGIPGERQVSNTVKKARKASH